MTPCNTLRGRSVRPPFALALLAASLASMSLGAHADDPPELPTVVVTATRQPSRADEQVADVSIITREEIEASRGRSLADLLSRQEGIQMSSNGGLGQTGSVFIRGTEARHTLLLIDGVRYGSATVGTPILDNIPIEQIDHIEIVRGPLSSLYGSDAVGGVIQVFTKRGNGTFEPQASITAGTGRYFAGSAGFSAGSERLDYHVGVAWQRVNDASATRPYAPFDVYDPDRDAFSQASATASLGYRLTDRWTARLQTLGSRGTVEYDDGVSFDGSHVNTRARLVSTSLAGTLEGTVLPFWAMKFLVGQSHDRNRTLASAFGDFGLSTFTTHQTQASWENRFATPIGSVLAAYEHTEQKVGLSPGDDFDPNERDINAGLLGLDGGWREHHWQTSLRHDRNSQFGGEDTGSAGYGYDLTPSLRIAASYGTSFVAPSFNQLYYPGFGNPLLQPEKGRSKEASLRWAEGGREARVAYFVNRIRGFITSGERPENIAHAKIDGVSASASSTLGDWRFGSSIDLIDPRNQDGDLRLPRRARQVLHLSSDGKVAGVGLGAELSMIGRRFDDTANTQRLGGYTTLDLHADYPLARDWTVALRIDDVTDKRYETAFGYRPAGRNAFVTLNWLPR